jgi:hypothetical protein
MGNFKNLQGIYKVFYGGVKMIQVYSKRNYIMTIFLLSICLISCSLSTVYGSELIITHDQEPYKSYAETSLSISGDGVLQPKTFTVKELREIKEGKVKALYTMQTLVEPHHGEFIGVSLNALLEEAGLKETAKTVKVICSDGLNMTFTLPEIQKQDYINSINTDKLPVILAYAKDGYPLVKEKNDNGYVLDAENDGGPIRLMVGQLEKGERNSPKCLKNITQIIVSTQEKKVSFNDIGQFYQWAKEAIEDLAEKEIVHGIGEGKFAPEKSLTRAEFAKMITNALKVTTDGNYTVEFKDVEEGDWFAPYVASAVQKGWIKGYEDHTFRPNQEVNRQEMITMVIRAIGLEEDAFNRDGKNINFKDKDKIPLWAIGSAEIAQEKGFLENISVGYFGGAKISNRAEAAVILYRMMQENIK